MPVNLTERIRKFCHSRLLHIGKNKKFINKIFGVKFLKFQLIFSNIFIQ